MPRDAGSQADVDVHDPWCDGRARLGEPRSASPVGPLAEQLGVRSSITVPIEGPTGFFGMLAVHATSPRDYAAGDVDFIQALANVLADALERQAVDDQMQHRALHDAMTGLPNRILFLDRLEHALDRLRRQAGTARRSCSSTWTTSSSSTTAWAIPRATSCWRPSPHGCKQAVRPSDTVARFGGDEFGLLLEELPNERDAISMAERVAALVRAAVHARHERALRHDEHRDRAREGRRARVGSDPRRRRGDVPREGAGSRAIRAVRRGDAQPGDRAAADRERPASRDRA